MEISYCSHSVSISAKRIQQDKLENGNEMLVNIYHEIFPPSEGYDDDSVEKFMGHLENPPTKPRRINDIRVNDPWFLACCPSDSTLVSTGGNGLYLWSIGKKDLGFELIGPAKQDQLLASHIECLAFSADGQLLACCTSRGDLFVCDVSSRTLRKLKYLFECDVSSRTLKKFRDRSKSFMWHPRDHLLFVCSRYRSAVCIVNADNAVYLDGDIDLDNAFDSDHAVDSDIDEDAVAVLEMGFVPLIFDISPDGKFICALSRGGTISIWNAESRERLHRVKVPSQGRFTFLEISPDSTRALCGSWDGEVLALNESGKLVTLEPAHRRRVTCISFAQSYPWAVTGGSDGMLIIWDLQSLTHRCLLTREEEHPIDCVSWLGASNRFLAAGYYNGDVSIWDSLSAECVKTFTWHAYPITSLDVSANGELLVVVDQNGLVCAFNIAEFK